MNRLTMIVVCLALSGCGIGYKPLTQEQVRRADLTTLRAAWADYHHQIDLSWASKKDWESWGAYLAAIRYNVAEQLIGATKEERESVRMGAITSGMPSDLVWWSWGPPEDTESSRTPYGQTDTWFYNYGGGYFRTSVTFNNGVVTWWHAEE